MGVGGVEDSLAGGQERLGVENRVGVSFIRAEAATEAMVVSMDSSSMSSMSNEIYKGNIFSSICHRLKGNIFDGCRCPWTAFKVILHLLLLTAQ